MKPKIGRRLLALLLLWILLCGCGVAPENQNEKEEGGDRSPSQALLGGQTAHTPLRPSVMLSPLSEVKLTMPYGSATITYSYDLGGGKVLRQTDLSIDQDLLEGEGSVPKIREIFTVSENGNLLESVKTLLFSEDALSEDALAKEETLLRRRVFGYTGGLLTEMTLYMPSVGTLSGETPDVDERADSTSEALLENGISSRYVYGDDGKGGRILLLQSTSIAEETVWTRQFRFDGTGLLTEVYAEGERSLFYGYRTEGGRIQGRTVTVMEGQTHLYTAVYSYTYDNNGRISGVSYEIRHGDGVENTEALPVEGDYEASYTYVDNSLGVPKAMAAASEELRFYTAAFGYLTDLDRDLLSPGADFLTSSQKITKG